MRIYLSIISRAGILLAAGLAAFLLYLLSISDTYSSVLSPWQTIAPGYSLVFFCFTLLVGFLVVFGELPRSLKLVLLGLFSFVVSSYLPLTHVFIYGADGWRHMANEAQIIAGHWPIKPLLADGTRAGFSLGDISYGLFWLVSVGASKLFAVSLLSVTKWLQPVLWAMCFPLLLWKFTGYFEFSKRGRYFVVWLSALPFALQAASAFSLPVNFGFIFFMAGMVLLAARAQRAAWATRKILAGYTLVLALNYLLYPLLYLLAWAVLELLVATTKKSNTVRHWLFVFANALLVLAIPLVELLFGYSRVVPIHIFDALRQLLGNLSGWYIAAGPRPHDIATANILFNQVPLAAFVPNFLTTMRWWLPIFAVGFWAGAIYFVYTTLQRWFLVKAAPTVMPRIWLTLVTSGWCVSYFIGRYILGGDQLLSRRMEVVLAFLAIICFGYFVELVIQSAWYENRTFMWFALLWVISAGITASYSLGPDTQTVSRAQYQAMQYVWTHVGQGPYCVVADTYPLLALEAISGGKIVGGGFPIDKNFGQPELQSLWQNFGFTIDVYDQKALQFLRQFNTCWFVGARPQEKSAILRMDHELNNGRPGGSEAWEYFGDTFAAKFTKSPFYDK